MFDRGRDTQRERKRLAVLSTQCLAWHGWCKMWCVLASAVARLPTQPAKGTVNHVNDPDPRDATAAHGRTAQYTLSTCGRAWRTCGQRELKATDRVREETKTQTPNIECQSLLVFFCGCTAAEESERALTGEDNLR